MWILISIIFGYLLDLLMGDPVWLPHPVVWIGKCIAAMEHFLRKMFPKTKIGERIAGTILAIVVPMMSFLFFAVLLYIAYRVSFWFWFVLHTFWAFQIPATRCLAQESKKVYTALRSESLLLARKQLSRLVGRETDTLSAEEVTSACVETVAENTSDGITAPLFYLMIGGVPLGMCYKAINTLDSMVGYQNESYRYFGTASAKLDDIANFFPSRLCGLLMCVAAFFTRLNGKKAFQIFIRDRKKHLSPNSAQTESVAAGALQIQLGGAHVYFGKLVEKPTIGDEIRPIEKEDILRMNRLMYVTSYLTVLVFGLGRIVFEMWR